MNHLNYELKGGKTSPIAGRPYALVGVVSSSSLEVMAQPQDLGGKCRFEIATTVAHFDEAWKAVIADFFDRNQPRDVLFSINDFGSSPPIVSLRLDQAWEKLST